MQPILYIRLAVSLLLCFLIQSPALAQQHKIDSLLNRIHNTPDDSDKIKDFDRLCRQYESAGNLDKALQSAREGLQKAKSIGKDKEQGWEKGIAICLNDIGIIYGDRGNYDSALINSMQALEIRKRIKDTKGEAQSHMCLGVIYYNRSSYDLALQNYFDALHFYLASGDKRSADYAYNSMGAIYGRQKKWDKALENFNESLKIKKDANDKEGIADVYSNIAAIYSYQNKFNQALDIQQKALQMRKEIGDKSGIAYSLNNIGAIEYGLHEYSKALQYYQTSLGIRKEIGDKQGMTEICYNLSGVYLKLNKPAEAENSALQSLGLAKETGSKEDIKSAYEALALCDSARNNWKGAYLNEALFKQYNDSIFNMESDKKMAELNASYENEKKEAKILLMEKDRKQQETLTAAEHTKQRIIQLSFVLGFVLLSVFSFFMYNRWRITRRQKRIIELQKKMVDEQKAMVDEKNKDITDSITYARRIQQAKLPRLEDISHALPDSFVLFKPRDIVSGDFYFFHREENRICIAAADCTGHGVPGAFMSMIGMDKLDAAVRQHDNPSSILSDLNREIKKSLRQSDRVDSTRDGMDIALCVIDAARQKLSYAGANRPLWIIRNGTREIEEYKATKKAIGGLTPDDTLFDEHEIICNPGDCFYLFSDGYADLFGGPDNKKITTRRFKEMLLQMQDAPMEKQKDFLNAFSDNWKGQTEQVDDILVIGIRF